MNFDERSFARMIDRTGGDNSPRSAHQEQLRRQVLEVFDRAQAGVSGPALFTNVLANWRWIMRHPVSRVAAAAIFFLALGAVALWFHGGGTQSALADFIQPILDAKSVKFKTIGETKGQPAVKGEAMVMAPSRLRMEVEMPGQAAGATIVHIADFEKRKMLTLAPDAKIATVTNIANLPKEKLPRNLFLELQSQLRDARERPDFRREPLGEKEIGGRRAHGYRLSGHGMEINLWGDPKTGLPLRVEVTDPMNPNTKVTLSDFVFNVDLDESLFSVEPPAGYTTQNVQVDYSQAGEKDLVETFRRYSQLSGGAFPDALNMPAMFQLAEKRWAESGPKEGQKANEQQMQERMDEAMRLARGLEFASKLTPQADAHYAGKGVSQGKVDTPIFWYRLKDAKKYRVIYADLSIREVDALPNMPNAQPVSAQSSPKN